MADTPQLIRPPEYTNDGARNLHYVIEQAGQSIAEEILDELDTIGYHDQRVKLAHLVLGVASRAQDVIGVAIAKLWDSPTFGWDDVTNAQIRTHMGNAWSACARGKFPEVVE